MSETPAVELVDAAAAVVVAVRVAMVLTPPQPDLGPSPMVLAPPRVSKVASRFLRGLYPPALGQSSVRDRCHALDPALVSMDLPPGGPPVESLLAVGFFAFLPLLGLPWLGVFLRFWCLWLWLWFWCPQLCLLGFLPGRRSHGFTLSTIRPWG